MKLSNKNSTLKCDRCKHLFNYKQMYAIGNNWGVVCDRCWHISMEEVAEAQGKKTKKAEPQFNLGGYDNQIYKSNTDKD